MTQPVLLGLIEFVAESNRIEGIVREPTTDEILASECFLHLFQVGPVTLCQLQEVFAPGKPLRQQEGMNVRVGGYVAPYGGSNIRTQLVKLLRLANNGADPWKTHVAYEKLHPFMDGNGRTGRMLWVWQMRKHGQDPFALPFLHRWYYQTLEKSR